MSQSRKNLQADGRTEGQMARSYFIGPSLGRGSKNHESSIRSEKNRKIYKYLFMTTLLMVQE